MTKASGTRLLLDRISVHGPMVEIGCNLLAQGPLTPQDFRGYVCPGLDGETAGELIPFLLDSGLVERVRGQFRLSASYRPDWTPQVNLLALLHGRTDVNYAFRFIWEALLDRPEWAGVFLNRDDLWPVINQVPVPGASLPQLNGNRMASWMRLASWLGLIQPERSNSFVLVPTQALVTDLLSITIPAGKETSLTPWVSAVEAQFCRVTLTPGELHPGFAAVLNLFAAKNQVEFSTYSDEHLYQVGTARVSHVTIRKGKAA